MVENARFAPKNKYKMRIFRYNELNKRNNSNHKLGDEQYGRIFV